MPGDKYASIKRPRVYRALRRRGYSKARAAAIANSQKAARYDHIRVLPPRGVRGAARRGVNWRKEYGRGGTQVGVARARDLRNGSAISPETAKWGGDTGRSWANKLTRQMDAADKREKAASSFVVYKQADGKYRWLAVSSTAYRDRDGEIVSTTALKQAVASADATGKRGPLLFWHIPGVVLGECDFQATAFDDRALIESGTFADSRIARAIARKADGMGMTIGFVHPLTEPDATGVFKTIDIVERSTAPATRVSNKFTRLSVHKERSMTDEKEKELKALFGDDADLLKQFLEQARQKDASLQASGVAHKATEKAEADKEDDDGGGADVDVNVDDEPTLTKADLTMIAEAVSGVVVDQILSRLDDIGMKMQQYDEEMSQRGYQRAKEATDEAVTEAVTKETEARQAEITTLKERLAALGEKLKELEGDQPTARPYRASQDAGTDVTAKVARHNSLEEAAADWLFPIVPNGGAR